MSKNLHVVPHEERWAIKQEGDDGTVSVHASQDEAVDRAETLAKERSVNVVVHRENGAFDHVERFSNGEGQAPDAGNAPRTRTASPGRVGVQDLASVGSRVSWSALLAGAVVALTIYLALGTLGVAVGLSTAGTRVEGDTLAIGAAVWAAVSMLVALFLGGFVTSKSTVGENHAEAMTYGLLLWGTIFVALTFLSGLGLNLGVGGMLGQMSGPGASSSTFAEDQLRGGDVVFTDEQIDTLKQMSTTSAHVRATTAAWWTFGTLIVSIIAAVGGGLAGAGPELSLESIRARRDALTVARK